MEILLFGFLIINILMWVCYAVVGADMRPVQFKRQWIIVSINVALLALLFVPKDFIDWDLLRLYRHIENIRSEGLDTALQYTEYRHLYVIKAWMYFVSLTKTNGLFQSIPLLMDFLIFGYIIYDICRKRCKSIKVRDALWVIFIWISLMGIKLSISDVRCTWAMGLCCLAFYKEYICGEKKWWAFFLYGLSMFIHHFVVLFLIFRIILIFKRFVLSRWLIWGGALASQFIIYGGATLLYDNVSNDYIRTMARKLLADWGIYGFSEYFINREASMKILYLCFIIVFVIGYIWSRKYILIVNDCETVDDNGIQFRKVNDALFVISCLGIGFAFNYLLLERLLYIAAYIFSIHVCMSKIEYGRIKNEMIIAPFLAYILFFNDINIFIVNALGHYYL